MVHHEQLFTAALQLQDPFFVRSTDFSLETGELHLYIDFRIGARFPCPVCREAGKPVHDTEDKVWRHLNFFQYKAFIPCRTPRVSCEEHGVRLIRRYVDKARKEADYAKIHAVGIDETSSRKGHNYVTLFVDLDKNQVVHVVPGKDAATIHSFKEMLEGSKIPPEQVTEVCTDMSIPFRKGIREAFPWAAVTYDKFHVIKSMNDALDKVRRRESREDSALKHSRYLWLRNPENLKPSQQSALADLTTMNLKTVRAYRIKLALQDVYSMAPDRESGEAMLRKWYNWAVRSRIDEVRAFARLVKNNWDGILNYFNGRLTSGIMESINSVVQSARNRARGYRNVENFITMIYLLGGKLDMELHISHVLSPI